VSAPPLKVIRRTHTRDLVRARMLPRVAAPVRPVELPAFLTRLPSVRGTAQKIRQPGKPGPRPYGPGEKPLTPAQRNLLIWLVGRIVESGGFYSRSEGEIAAETCLSRATVISTLPVLRDRGLVESEAGRRKNGGTAAMRFRLHLQLRRLLSPAVEPLSKKSTPKPDRVQPETSDVRCASRGLGDGRAARAALFASLRDAAKPRQAGLSVADIRVLMHVSETCPPRWHQRALQLAEHAGSPAGASIKAVGAWLRQSLADTIRAAWDEVPRSWRVSATGERKLALLREENGWPMKRPKPEKSKPVTAPAPIAPPGLSLAADAAKDFIRRLLAPPGSPSVGR
jgi:hypothetical protein